VHGSGAEAVLEHVATTQLHRHGATDGNRADGNKTDADKTDEKKAGENKSDEKKTGETKTDENKTGERKTDEKKMGEEKTEGEVPEGGELPVTTVCMLSNILCYCSDDATAELFARMLSPGGGVSAILVNERNAEQVTFQQYSGSSS